jgi:hypothetical protein
VLEELHAGHHIELAGVQAGVFLRRGFFVMHREPAFMKMKLGDAQRLLRKVDPGHARPAPCHGLGEDAAAAADVEHRARLEARMPGDPFQAQRIDVVQRPELAFRVPPAVGEVAEFFDFGRVDVGHEPF